MGATEKPMNEGPTLPDDPSQPSIALLAGR